MAEDINVTGTNTGATGASTTGIDPLVGQRIGTESSLSNWAGPYVTEMLGRGMAAASTTYQAYTGTLTATPSGLQTQAWTGLAGLTLPTGQQTQFTPTSFTDTGVSQQYMNPYVQTALDPQIFEARRQSEIENLKNKAAATRAGAYGGSRQALMESENQRNLLQNLALLTGKGYETAYTKGAEQFNTEQARQQAAAKQAQDYGLAGLAAQAGAGATQRDVEQQGITADYTQFQEQRDYPYKQVQYLQSLLQNMPLATQSYSYQQPSALSEAMGSAGGIKQLYNTLFGGK
jgi:predicted RNA-binding protein Jag